MSHSGIDVDYLLWAMFLKKIKGKERKRRRIGRKWKGEKGLKV